MVKLSKRLDPPAPIYSEHDYRSNPNFKQIHEDCFGKCYIYEYDKSTSLNVEHLIPHRGCKSLKFSWNNLFLSCGHCNNTKLDKFDRILNPAQSDPEEHLALSLSVDLLEEEVVVTLLSEDESTKQTADLLRLVYNGGTTDIKDIECTVLRNAISDCLASFHLYIKLYRDEPDSGFDTIIRKEISKSSPFAAFKRKIVRDDPELLNEFADALT